MSEIDGLSTLLADRYAADGELDADGVGAAQHDCHFRITSDNNRKPETSTPASARSEMATARILTD